MNFFNKLVIVGFLLTLSLGAEAQDIHFSQFYMSPMNLNPALTGVMNCKSRFVANYRNQWASVLRSNAYNTYSASYDQRVPVGRYDYMGFGGTLWGDKAGQVQFSTLQAKVSGSYSKQMGGDRNSGHFLVAGAELGVSQRSIDFFKAQWGEQNDNGTFNGSKPSNELNLNRDNFLFADVSAGLLWFSVFDEYNNFYVGGAYSHLNRANQSFRKDKYHALWSKFTLHAGGEFQLSDRFSLVPGLVTFIQGPSLEVNAGTSFKFQLTNPNGWDNQSFQVGTFMRLANRYKDTNGDGGGILADALILSARFDYNDFAVGFSYDLNVSSLKVASQYNGGFEFALIYKMCGPESRNVYCPNF